MGACSHTMSPAEYNSYGNDYLHVTRNVLDRKNGPSPFPIAMEYYTEIDYAYGSVNGGRVRLHKLLILDKSPISGTMVLVVPCRPNKKAM